MIVSSHIPSFLSSSISYGSSSSHNNLLVATNKPPIKKQKGCGCSSSVRSFYTEETLYQVLGISERGSTSLSSSDIKKAYKEMARKYHPDVSPPERVDEYTKKFILVHEAYETLSDPHSRALYDRDLSTNFNLSRYTQRRKDRDESSSSSVWRTMSWQSQLDGLKRRGVERQTRGGDDMSWGARMRRRRTTSQTPSSSSS